MKKRIVIMGMALAILPFLLVAQTPPVPTVNQVVTGTAQETFGATFGTLQLGAGVSGWSNGSFTGIDTTQVTGTAQGTGTGNGMFSTTVSPNAAASSAAGSIASVANADGNVSNTVSVAGSVTQGNWATVPGTNSSNFSGAANTTTAGYNGAGSGVGPTQATGAAGATGNSVVSLTQSPTTASSTALTQGQSAAQMTGASGAATANGYGAIATGSMVGGGSNYAGGQAVGTAIYNSPAGSQNAAGSLYVNGYTSGILGPGNSVSAIAEVTSTANGLNTGAH